MNNSTSNEDVLVLFVKQLNGDICAIFGCVMTIDSVCLLVLSIGWMIYLISQMVKDRKRYKIQLNTRYCSLNWCRNNYVKNYKSNKVKNTLFIVICLSEFVLIMSGYLYESGRWSHRTRERKFLQFDITTSMTHEVLTTRRYTESLRNPIILISNTITAISVCSIFLFVNFLTQYLVHTYSYYQRVFKLKQKIIISISLLTILFILGLIKPLILLQYTLTFLLIISQFIILCNATNKLQKLLKQRLKDSITHENQSVFDSYRYPDIMRTNSLKQITINNVFFTLFDL